MSWAGAGLCGLGWVMLTLVVRLDVCLMRGVTSLRCSTRTMSHGWEEEFYITEPHFRQRTFFGGGLEHLMYNRASTEELNTVIVGDTAQQCAIDD